MAINIISNDSGHTLEYKPLPKTITTTVKSLAFILDEEDESIVAPIVFATREEAQEAKDKIENLLALYRERSFHDILVDIKYNPNYFNAYQITVFTQIKGDGMEADDWVEAEMSSGQCELDILKALEYALPLYFSKLELKEMTRESLTQLGIQIQGDLSLEEIFDEEETN
jgi:hypothetical protein